MKNNMEKLKEDDPIFKQGFVVSSHNRKIKDYIAHREKTENKKNLFRTCGRQEFKHVMKQSNDLLIF